MRYLLLIAATLGAYAFAEDPEFMTDAQVKRMYQQTSVESTPAGTQIKFSNWIIPANSACSNNKKVGSSSCMVCGAGVISRETRQLGTYQTSDVGDADANPSVGIDTVRLRFKGVGDNFELKCDMVGGAGNVTEFACKLKPFGINLKFKKHQTATLQEPSSQPDASQPADAAG